MRMTIRFGNKHLTWMVSERFGRKKLYEDNKVLNISGQIEC